MGDGNGGNEGLKKCANCEEWLPIDAEHYTKDKCKQDGLSSYCRVCAQMRTFLYNRRRGLVKRPDTRTAEEKRARYKERRRAEYLRLRTATIERARKWRAEHPGATWKQVKDWAVRNPGAYNAYRTNLRARRGGNLDRVSADDMMQLRKQQGNLCAYCKEPLTKCHIDHRTPLSRGGGHEISNLALTCPKCNLRKHTKTAEEFMIELSRNVTLKVIS